MKSTLKLSLVQLDPVWENREANFTKVESLVKGLETDCILLPEMFATGFTMNSHSFAEDREGLTEAFMRELAQKKECYVGGGWIEKNPSGLPFNTMSIFSPEGNIVIRYQKIHPFAFAKEHQYFSNGQKTVQFQWEEFTVAPFICYDLRFPESFREMIPETNVYFVIGNWPTTRMAHWLTLLRARAIENQAYVVGVNRVGVDGNGIAYNGFSSVFDPFGEGKICGTEKEDVLEVEITINRIKEIREKFPFLQDRK